MLNDCLGEICKTVPSGEVDSPEVTELMASLKRESLDVVETTVGLPGVAGGGTPTVAEETRGSRSARRDLSVAWMDVSKLMRLGTSMLPADMSEYGFPESWEWAESVGARGLRGAPSRVACLTGREKKNWKRSHIGGMSY